MLADIEWNQNTLAVAGVFAVPIVAIAMYFYHKTQQMRSEHELKRQMIERGMSADEIERVIAATTADKQAQ